MEINFFSGDDARYPSTLSRFLGKNAPKRIAALGNLEILSTEKLAWFSSIKCPGNLILQTYDLARNLRQQGVTVMGGFHSPMEREGLTILLRGKQPVTICPARTIGQQIAREYAEPIEQGRLLILSPFDEKHKRITAETSITRNRFVAALTERVFVAYAEPDGKLEALCREIIKWHKPLFTFVDKANENLIALGARPITDGASL